MRDAVRPLAESPWEAASGRAGEPAAGESGRASGNLDDAPHRPRLPSYPPVGPTDRLPDLYGSLSTLLGITVMKVDFGRTADDYARYRAGFPEALFVRLDGYGIGRAGQRILDLGSGTGSLARSFARRGARVTALDLSEDLLAQARALAAEEGLEIETLRAPAEDTGLADSAFDVVAAGQCWHWFDRPKAAREARRLLASGRCRSLWRRCPTARRPSWKAGTGGRRCTRPAATVTLWTAAT